VISLLAIQLAAAGLFGGIGLAGWVVLGWKRTGQRRWRLPGLPPRATHFDTGR
jgi:hypothetical protein